MRTCTKLSDTNLDKNFLSVANINFLTGSGFNGATFPQLNGLAETISLIKAQDPTQKDKDIDIEKYLNSLENATWRDRIKKSYKDEISKYNDNFINDFLNNKLYAEKKTAVENIISLIRVVNNIVDKRETRQAMSNQINFYTLNHDDVLCTLIKSCGYCPRVATSKNVQNVISYADVVDYDYKYNMYLPTYFISKLHGGVDNPVLPSNKKYEQCLNEDNYQIFYKMIEQLSKPNSILFVIGYKGNDEHVNQKILECMKNGLTVYWLKYSPKEKISINLPYTYLVEHNKDINENIDSTLYLRNYLKDMIKVNED